MTAPFWTVRRIAEALAAGLVSEPPAGDAPVTAISTDTRAIKAGDCFVALAGERYDAHDFVSGAVEAGATAVVVDRPLPGLAEGVAVFVVNDTLVALGSLARYRRVAWSGPLVAIAGSNGKTSTKELLSAALSSSFRVHATHGNLNNRVGVPLTLLGLSEAADVAVVELGTSLPGEVAMLREIALPDVAVVTSIAEEHLEGLGDIAGILAEESAVFEDSSVAVIPASHPELREPASRARRVISAGLESGDMRADSWSLAADGSGEAVVEGVRVHSPLRGSHNLRNLMLALAAAQELGVGVAEAARGIAGLTPPPMRAHWESVGHALVINDAYNSNPGSAVAALEMLAAAPGGQRVAILGTMRELGSNSDRCHDDVARAALESSADVIAGIGEFSAALRRVGASDPRVVTAADVEQLWPVLCGLLAPDAAILLKASRGVRLERILPMINDWATRTC